MNPRNPRLIILLVTNFRKTLFPAKSNTYSQNEKILHVSQNNFPIVKAKGTTYEHVHQRADLSQPEQWSR